MKKHFVSLAVMALALAPAAFAKNDAMSLIPNDSVSVGVVRLSDMRSSPLSAALFAQTANISSDGDAQKFLTDAGLQPAKDVDVIVFATSPRTALGSEADFLIAADGRFNVERLSAALVARGAVKKTSAKGIYYVLPQKSSDHTGVVAFPDSHLALIGSEAAVIEALASRASGGTTFATTSGLGRDMVRVDPHATAFLLVDVPRAQRITGAPKLGGNSAQSQALGAALKNVSTVAIWATDTGDSLKLSALGLSTDSETLGLVEDTLRGALSAMRLAVADQNPDLVAVLRKFTVTRTDNSVAISGSVSGDTFRTWVAKSQSHAGNTR